MDPLPQAFLNFIADLIAQADAESTAAVMPGVAPRVWQVPSNFPAGVDIQNPIGFIQALARDALNYSCIAEYQAGDQPSIGSVQNGRRGAVMAFKQAIDYQAAYERAMHARHASGLRCRVWASSRRAGMGDGDYGVFACVLASIQSLLTASRSVDNTSQPPTST